MVPAHRPIPSIHAGFLSFFLIFLGTPSCSQSGPEDLFLFALHWQQSNVSPNQFDYFSPDLLCTLAGDCSPSDPGLIGDAAIAGRKFLDRDRDGVFDPTDEPANGFTVRLYDASGEEVASALTQDIDLDESGGIDPLTESGVYRFANIPAGSYHVGETPPLAYARTTQNASSLIEVTKGGVGLVAADLDGDLDNDLVLNRGGSAAGTSRGLTILINEGAGTFIGDDIGYGSSNDDFQSDPVVGDFNLDGLTDLVVGTGQELFVIRQTMSGSFLASSEEFFGSFSSDVRTADLNNDNAPDVVGRLGSENQIYYFLNQGLDGTDTWLGLGEPTILGGTGVESLDVGDIDGDTFPDIVTGLGLIYTNDGNGNFTPSTDTGIESISASANDLLLLDVDGDSDLDAVLMNSGFQGDPDFTVATAKNNGSGVFTPAQSFYSVRPAGIHPVDLENDGDIDIAVRVLVNGDDLDADFIQYLVNGGSGDFTLVTGPFITGEDNLAALVGADLDGVPGEEVAYLLGSTGFGNPEFVGILENPLGRVGVEALSSQVAMGPDFGNTLSAAIVEGQKFEDLNGNGIKDPGESGMNGVRINAFTEGSGMLLKATVITANKDLNGDNLIDPETERGRYKAVFEPDFRSENVLLEEIPEGFSQTLPNNPQVGFTDSNHERFMPEVEGLLLIGSYETFQILGTDLNGDGATDILCAGQFDPEGADPTQNVIQTFLNDGEGRFNDPDEPFLELVALYEQEFETMGQITGLAAGDFDGDGNQDFAALERDSASIRLYRGIGAGEVMENGTVDRGAANGPGFLLAVDVDNDEDLDLVSANSQNVSVLRNDGAGSFSLEGTTYGTGTVGTSREMVSGDFNGDGFADLAVAHTSAVENGVFVLLNGGVDGGNAWQGFNAGTNVAIELGSFDFARVAAGNLDGDQDIELASANGDEELVILDNDGTGGFTISDTIPTGLDYVGDIEIIDQNKDGFLDIVAMGDEDGFDTAHENGRIFRSDGMGGFTAVDPFFAFEADHIEIGDFDSDGEPEIGFHTDRSQRLGYYDFLQSRYFIEADIGDVVTGVDFGNFPLSSK